jgi:aminoglycoside 6'-N-acetyltransferase
MPAIDDWLQLGVRESATGRLVGDLALHKIAEGEFEIGFTLATAEQGKGYAYESATRLIQYLFEDAQASKVIATPDSRNTKSISLLRKLGFTQNSSKAWVEEFKGETVTVEFFELQRPKTD